MEDKDSRHTTVLFADVSESTKIYELVGDTAAHNAIDACIGVMRRTTEMFGGRVVKTLGDEILAVFGTPDAAAAAAAEMQAGIDAMLPIADRKLGLRIGFHAGPVLQEKDDVFGDTVNLASRLVSQAVKNQIVLTSETAAQLGKQLHAMTRDLYGIQVKGKSEDVALCEFVWRKNDEDTTVLASGRKPSRRQPTVLRLQYRNKEVVRRRDNDSVIIGRDNDCGIMVADHMASRRHCSIERRQDKWILKDHSTNGTFVTLEGDSELLLQREELILRKRGWITFGQARAGTTEVVEFFVD
jgi:adenylate cyclase